MITQGAGPGATRSTSHRPGLFASTRANGSEARLHDAPGRPEQVALEFQATAEVEGRQELRAQIAEGGRSKRAGGLRGLNTVHPHQIRASPPASAQALTEGWPGSDPSLIWYAETETFNIAVLKQAILVRGFTAESLAQAAGLSRGTIYNALTGHRTRIRTARRILESLSAATPAFRLSELSSIG